MKHARAEIDPITLEVMRGSFTSIVAQMRATLVRTAYSSVIYDTHDFSCCLLSPGGEIVGMSEEFPGHVFALSWGVPHISQKFGDAIQPGDVMMMNDPYVAGTHLNDVMFYTPYFAGGRLIMYVGVIAHWQDVGGASTGSLTSRASHILEEGIRVPPVKIVERGVKNAGVWDIVFSNLRFPHQQEGDALAMIDTARIAALRLDELCAKYGAETVAWYRDAILESGEQLMRSVIAGLPDGVYHYENYLDNNGITPAPLPVRLALTITGDSMTFDFSGTAPQSEGPINAGPCVAPVGIFIVVKSWLDPDTPINGGALRPLKFVLPEGSIVGATYPAGVGGCWEIKNAAIGAALGCFAQFMPEDALGGEIQGGVHCIVAGKDRHGSDFMLYEFPFGGYPATAQTDGPTGCFPYDGGDFRAIQPAEVLEPAWPLVAESASVRPDGESAGRRRSGFGVERRVRVLGDATLAVNGGRFVIPAFGLHGGAPGTRNRWTVLRDGVELDPFDEVQGKVRSYPLRAGDIVIMRSSAGGSVGDPLTRDPQLVLQDFAQGYVSAERARNSYGVVIGHDGIDIAATEMQRRQIAEARRYYDLEAAPTDAFDRRGLRLCQMSPEEAARIGAIEGSMVEYVPSLGAPLRAWVTLLAGAVPGQLPLGPIGRAILRAQPGARMQLRLL
jgi:N-methylhydantoinase B